MSEMQERIERHMAFITEQQAKFVTDLEQLREEQRRGGAETRQHIDTLTLKVSMLADALLSLTNIVEKHDGQIADNSRQIAELVEQGKETDARLNALITVVERHVSGHGGA
jgi:hypothetical protein